ncbi:MAG: hypothetical protein U1C74_17835 [Phenylobacterium sp.]|nr:hypothetical protein [Phenylobacterium sp.]
MTRDPLSHGRLLSIIQRLERTRDQGSAEGMLRIVERTGCGVQNHWVRVVELKAEIEKTPYLGREVTVSGVLVKDQSENYRVKFPDGQASWIVGPEGVDPRWMGSQVTVRGATAGASRLKVLSITPH